MAKRAYILSRQLKEYQQIGTLMRSIFFLATPHRGADLAETLSRVLAVSSGARPFVVDLHPTSKSIQSINEEFPRYSDALDLFSFHETLPMNLGIRKRLVVEKESATLGYDNERTTYLDADHRGVCKFDSRESTNYRSVRNALAATFRSLRNFVGLQKKQTFPELQQLVNEVLDINDPPEDDLLRVEALKLPGSCEWISPKEQFQNWLANGQPNVYWVTAKPGAGKSVLSGHVLRTLRHRGADISFFFFSHGDKLKSSMGYFFRSMAWQMAALDPAILESMAKVCKREPQLGSADHRTIWRKLFVEVAFKSATKRPQFWVIDGLDESKNDPELVPYLLQAAATGFIRLFITSRTLFETYGALSRQALQVHVDAISEETSNADIELYVKENAKYLPVRERDYTAKLLLKKSAGCFLWTVLALKELKHGLTRKGIKQILEETPSDMDELYDRIIRSTFEKAREADMIKAILDWTGCSTRPLTTEELYHALRLDMDDEIDGDIRRFIEGNCGQLVMVDSTDRVRMVHLTAREFLFSEKNTSFRLDHKVGHKRLAMACLKYLAGPEMAGGRARKLSAHQVTNERSGFVAYAATALFEHINFVDSEDDGFATSLSKFLRSANILNWIEYIARSHDLSRLVHAGHALKRYAARRKKKTLPFGKVSKEISLFDSWAIDLVRLVTKFGTRLQESPSSIVNLIAPFCPPESAIRTQFASSNRAIKVNGIASVTWDDCLSTIVQEHSIGAVACSFDAFALGLQDGDVIIYDETVCQPKKRVTHSEPVKKLLFGTVQPVLVAAGLRKLSLWNTDSWDMLHTFDLENQFISLALAYEDQLLLATCRSNEICIWDTKTGDRDPPRSWLDEADEAYSTHFRRPITTALSPDQTLLAIAYRGQDISVWDIDNGVTHDIYGKDEGSLGPTSERRKGIASAWSMIFSNAPEMKLLVVGYNDGVLNLFNMEEGTLQAKAAANAHTLASSNDGLTLACGNSGGVIQLFEFETLRPLYKIQADELNIKQIAFSSDDRRLIDIQSRHCRLWDPPVLVRQSAEDEENSDTVSVSTNPQDFMVTESATAPAITALTAVEGTKFAICGKDDGNVHLYDTMSGQQVSIVLQHTQLMAIVLVEYDEQSRLLVTADVSSVVLVHKLLPDPLQGFVVGPCLLRHHAHAAVLQVLVNPSQNSVLISTEKRDFLWTMPSSESSQELTQIEMADRRRHRWVTHPRDPNQLVLFVGNTVHLFSWTDLSRLTVEGGIELFGTTASELTMTAAATCFNGAFLSTTYAESASPHSRARVVFWDSDAFTPSSTIVEPAPHLQELGDQVRCLLGPYSHRLVFLHQDGWICSADSHSFDPEHYDRHFFLPADWLSTVTRLQMEILARDGTVLFVKRDELISVRRGMEYYETGQSRGLSKRPSLSSSGSRGSEETVTEAGGSSLAARLRLARLGSG